MSAENVHRQDYSTYLELSSRLFGRQQPVKPPIFQGITADWRMGSMDEIFLESDTRVLRIRIDALRMDCE